MRGTASGWIGRAARGAAAGFGGTLAIAPLLEGSQRWWPSAAPPLREDPGDFMVRRSEEILGAGVPPLAEAALARSLALGYGVAFGTLYALARPNPGSTLADGTALGLGTWAAGYLGWLPALGLMPPVWRQRPLEALAPLAEHVLFGVVTVAAYRRLSRRARRRAGTR